MMKDDEIQELLEAVYAGQVSPRNLPKHVFDAIVKELRPGVVKGFGDPEEFAEGSEKRRIVDDLSRNVRVFSAAKTFQQVKDMTANVFDESGNKRDFQQFRDIGKQVFDKYNEEWLKTEQRTAFNQSRSAKHWSKIAENKELFPFLRYRTQGDDRVRDEHRDMEGITRPVDDSFWDTHFPPNGWNCRCPKPRQIQSANSTDTRSAPEPESLFRMNPGRDGMVFKEDVGDGLEHPYFKVDQRYEVLKEQGFGLL